MTNREAANATADKINRLEQVVRDASGEMADVRHAAVDEATSIFDQILASARDVGRALRSVRESAEVAGDTATESLRATGDLARTSAQMARSTAEEARSIGTGALRGATAMGESARDALDDVAASVEHARQVVGDAIGGSAAERIRGSRASRRTRLGLLVSGLAGGAVATYLLDAEHGAYRRQAAVHQLRRWGRTASEVAAMTSHQVRVRVRSLMAANATTAYLETTTWEIDSGATRSANRASSEERPAEPAEGDG